MVNFSEIEEKWQFRKLKEKGLLIQKPYYGTFCPNCGPVAVDPSETDLSKGGNASNPGKTGGNGGLIIIFKPSNIPVTFSTNVNGGNGGSDRDGVYADNGDSGTVLIYNIHRSI